MISAENLLNLALARGASDIHVVAGSAPRLRVRGRLEEIAEIPAMGARDVEAFAEQILTKEQIAELRKKNELDCAYAIPQLGRFRVNARRQRGVWGLTMRVVPREVPGLKDLKMPAVIEQLCDRPRGLILVTGAMGSGKSTTLAAMLDHINRTRQGHIVTVEDPIEHVHPNRGCLVEQREVGEDTASFAAALKHALRQDCNVLMLGEMRDVETVEIALTAAETGMLVLGTLHTNDAVQSVERIVNVFPGERQGQARMQLSMALEAVVCQQLIPRADGAGVALACEVMIANPGIRNLIRKGETAQIRNALVTGRREGGEREMFTMDQSLAELYSQGAITREAALARAVSREDLDRLLALR
ncbi:MAG: type IV pilus twitching motility protein PilT [Candidatus Methylomirabilis sp.]|nr:type IV pilus twitching motility protein PilT [Deltaproteobacteria bacterium]